MVTEEDDKVNEMKKMEDIRLELLEKCPCGSGMGAGRRVLEILKKEKDLNSK